VVDLRGDPFELLPSGAAGFLAEELEQALGDRVGLQKPTRSARLR
jgi:hypothetical protein